MKNRIPIDIDVNFEYNDSNILMIQCNKTGFLKFEFKFKFEKSIYIIYDYKFLIFEKIMRKYISINIILI